MREKLEDQKTVAAKNNEKQRKQKVKSGSIMMDINQGKARKTNGDGGQKTALVLSGGGSRGAYQIGVWQALKEMGIHIDIVTGTSAGAINGAVIAQDGGEESMLETACSIWRELETDKVFDFTDAMKNGGGSYTDFKEMLNGKLDEQKIRENGTKLGIVTVEFPSMEPRYLWLEDIPRGKLLDYVLASASCFPAIQSYEIGDSRYIDGGYSDNLPVGMALEKGATDIIAVNLASIGVIKKDKLEEAERCVLIEAKWDLGNWLLFDRVNTRRILRLGYLDGMKAYDAFDGERYTFIKGAMDKRYMKGAEEAGAVFDLDPGIIYSEKAFHSSLAEAIRRYKDAEKKEIEDAERALNKSPLGVVIEKSALAKSALNGFLTNLAKLPPANARTMILLLALHLKETDVKRSLLMSRPALALFSKEINAAYYLVRAGLV